MSFPPQDLRCPDPANCPVLATLPTLPRWELPAGSPQYRVYDTTWGYDEFNPGFGDTRFAPFDDSTGRRIPAMYLADTEIAALLETVFHDVHQVSDRNIYEQDLRERALVHVQVPQRAWLVDLRDPALAAAGTQRDELVSTSAEHYPCTRRCAAQLHGRSIDGRAVQGLVWHSRQAEVLGRPPEQVAVLFGDRYGTTRGSWTRIGPGARNLVEGPGRLLVDELANELDATVQPHA